MNIKFYSLKTKAWGYIVNKIQAVDQSLLIFITIALLYYRTFFFLMQTLPLPFKSGPYCTQAVLELFSRLMSVAILAQALFEVFPVKCARWINAETILSADRVFGGAVTTIFTLHAWRDDEGGRIWWSVPRYAELLMPKRNAWGQPY